MDNEEKEITEESLDELYEEFDKEVAASTADPAPNEDEQPTGDEQDHKEEPKTPEQPATESAQYAEMKRMYDESEERLRQSQEQNNKLAGRLDKALDGLATDKPEQPDKARQYNDDELEDMPRSQFLRIINDNMKTAMQQTVQPINQRFQNQDQEAENRMVENQKTAVLSQIEKCQKDYKDFGTYRETIGRSAIDFAKKHGLQALIDRGYASFYKEARYDAAVAKQSKQQDAPKPAPPEKPSATPAGAKAKMTADQAFETACEMEGVNEDFFASI